MPFLKWLRMLKEERRTLGWKGLLKKRGWTLVVIVIVFYLIRDVILYVLVPAGVVAWLLP